MKSETASVIAAFLKVFCFFRFFPLHIIQELKSLGDDQDQVADMTSLSFFKIFYK